MEQVLLKLYRVKWKHTANSYCNLEDLKKVVRFKDSRCDDILEIEEVFLPAFDNDDVRNSEYLSIFIENRIM